MNIPTNTPQGAPRSRPSLADASAVRSIVGLRSWGAVLVALVLTAIGAAVDGVASGALGWGFRIGFVAGVGLAALVVRRGSIFTAMVQPPLVMAVVAFIALRLIATERTTFTLIKLVNAFPTMLVGTVLAVLLGLVRLFAQPIRKTRKPVTAHPVRT